MYAGKTKEERDELAQFFTPPEISIKLLEMYNVKSLINKVIQDPCSGSGNLLAAAIIAGADLDKVLGNDYDAAMVKLCRERIRTIPDRLEEIDKEFANSLKAKLKEFHDWQIHQGNALHEFALTYFGKDYEDYYFGNVKEDYAKARRLNNLRQVKLTGSLDLQEYELDYNIYSSIKFKEAHPQEYNEHLLSVNNRIRKETAEVTDKSFTGDLW